jgi:hypothetical protein
VRGRRKGEEVDISKGEKERRGGGGKEEREWT